MFAGVRISIKEQLTMNISKNDLRKTALIAVGGNSLIVSKDKQTIPDQYEAAV